MLASVTDPAGRYRLTLTIRGKNSAIGWWHKPETARRKFTSWVGDYGRPGTEVVLVDTETGTVVRSWPDTASGTRSGREPLA